MKINIEDILDASGRTIFKRGVVYQQEGRADIADINTRAFTAEIRGSESYTVSVEEIDGQWHAECSCPFPLTCKHIVAALLEARQIYTSNLPQVQQAPEPESWKSYFETWRELSMGDQPAGTSEERWRVTYLLTFFPGQWTLRPQKVYIKQDETYGRMAGLSQIDTSDPSLEYAPNDPLVVSHLNRTAESDTSKRSGFRSRSPFYTEEPQRFKDGQHLGDVFDFLRESLILQKDKDRKFVRIQYAESSARLQYGIVESDEMWRIEVLFCTGSIQSPLDTSYRILTQNPIWILHENSLYKVEDADFAGLAILLTSKNQPPPIPRSDLKVFIEQIYPGLCDEANIKLPDSVVTRQIEDIGSKKIQLSEVDRHLDIKLILRYGELDVPYSHPRSRFFRLENDVVHIIRRNEENEKEIYHHLIETGLRPLSDGTLRVTGSRVLTWMFNNLSRLEQEDFEIVGRDTLSKYRIRTGEPNVEVQISSKIDWFDLNIKVDVEGIQLKLSDLKKAIRKKNRIVKLSDGSLARIPEDWFDRFRTLFHFSNVTDEGTQVARFHATLIDTLFEESNARRTDRDFEKMVERLRLFKKIKKKRIPKRLKGKLRPYQKAGYDWLYFLNEFGFGGCLADDMGLGKTIQTLALLQHEKESGPMKPNLVVCPTSVVFNWQKEIERFTPDLRVGQHTGLVRNLSTQIAEEPDIILTTYGIMLREIESLMQIKFHYVILDESQKIKNPDSQTARAACLLDANHRLVLTGTPVENNTLELWSQFHFLNPGLLGSLTQFRQMFTLPIEKHQHQEPAELLRKLIFPFILRRNKEHVARELPPKFEQVIHCPMNPEQLDLYTFWRDHYRAMLLDQIDSDGLAKSRMHILQGLSKLRQIACHARLVDNTKVEDSGKFESLKEFVAEITAEKHKILIFSQFVRMLKLVRAWCDEAGYAYSYLDGATRKREEEVERFQTDPAIPLFLISLKAGGTGLNLTAADYVIHIDPWWNPAVEMQATDRAHRIGQDKPVFVYRLITKDSVEEKMLELQGRKKSLVDNLIRADSSFFKSMTREDVETLFS